MFDVLIKEVVYGNGWFYSLILMFILASFIASMLFLGVKTFQMIKNNYYTFLFEKDLWTQSLEKNIDNAKKWDDLSTLVKMFSEGFKTFMLHYRKNTNYDSGSTIHLTKGTMKVIMMKDQEIFNQGLNLLAFNAIFIPYASLSLAMYDIISVFMSVELSALTLTMFLKPLAVIMQGFILTGVSTTLYFVYQNRMEIEKEKFEIFIEEFGNFLHKNFYNGE